MFQFLVRIILRNRLVNLIIILALTVSWLYGTGLKISYEITQMFPSSDSTSIA